MKFSESLWKQIEPVFARILEHPFLRGLTDGSLPEESFRFYVIQDSLYLRDYGRGLALLAAKSGAEEELMMFCEHARTSVLVERALHDTFFRAWGVTPEILDTTPQAPTTLLYTSYLLRVAWEQPYAAGVAAFLPCYWIYLEAGKALERAGSPNAFYHQWISTYASDEFEGVCADVRALTDRLAARLTEEQRAAMARHFSQTARFEYMFWDMGWRREQWPV